MRLKRNYIMISSKDVRKWEDFKNNSVSNSQFQSPDKDEIQKHPEAQLKLPKKKSDIRNLRINKLQKIIEKTTSRYDEDYQINFIHKIKNQMVDKMKIEKKSQGKSKFQILQTNTTS